MYMQASIQSIPKKAHGMYPGYGVKDKIHKIHQLLCCR